MRYTWDETKRRTNIQKHGIDFADCSRVFAADTLSIELDLESTPDQRFKTLGFLDGRAVSVVHADDDNGIRIISARKATRNEEKALTDNLGNRLGSPGPVGR